MPGTEQLAITGLELLDVGVALFDAETRLVYANGAFRRMRDYPDDVCRPGTTLEALLRFNADRGDFGPGEPAAQVAERLGEIKRHENREIERPMADGQILAIKYRRMEGGGLLVTFEDRTDQRRAEAALRASEERYALVADAAEEAIYEWNIADGRFFASPRLTAMLGRETSATGERDWRWNDLIHPDDLPEYLRSLEAHLSGEVQRWRCEYRLRDAKGGWRWVSDHGTSIRGDDGRAVRMIAAIRDITDRVVREAALAASEERHALVSRATSDGIYDWNVTDDMLYVSENLTRILDFDLGIKASRMWADRVHPEDYQRYADATRAHLKGETDAIECEYRVRAKGGGYRWVHDRGVGVRGPDGRVTRLVGAVRDITDVKDTREERDRIETRLLSSLATISDGILLVDAENRVQLWNDRYFEIFTEAAGGADLSKVIIQGRPFADMIRDGYNLGMFKPHPDGVDYWVAERMKAWDQAASQWELELANGTWILLNERQMPDGGRVSVYTDITEFKRREQEAQAARQRFEEAIEAISAGFALWDRDDRLVVCNSRYRAYFADMADIVVPGVTFREAMSAAIERGVIADLGDDLEVTLDRVASLRSATTGEPREQHLANGRWLHITDHRTAEGGIVSIYTDVTEIKTSEREARAARARFEEAIESISAGFSLWDADDRLVICNSTYKEFYAELADAVRPGTRFRNVLEVAATRGLIPAARDDPAAYVEANLQKRERGLGQLREHRLSSGRWLQITDHRTADGGIVSIHTDVTELKEKQAEIEAQSAIVNATLENMGQGITMVDRDLKVVAFNRKFLELMDWPEDQFGVGFTMEEAFRFNAERGEYGPGDVEEQVRERVELARKFLPHKFERTRPDGTVIEIIGNPTESGGMVATYTDITERKRAEQALRDAEARLRGILENSPIGVSVIGDDNIIRFHNPRFAEILGGAGENLVGTSSKRFWTDLKERERSMERFRKEGRVTNREVMYRGIDGRDVWCLSTYERAEWEGDPARLIWIYDTTEAKANREALVVARDAAEAALADLQKAQQRLIQAEKMASLGQLTAGIAHEIKNPLNFVNNFAKLSDEMLTELAEILEKSIKALDPETRDDAEDLMATVRENLGKINEHGRRADSIVKNMLLHSRAGPAERQVASINAIAEEALNLAYHGARAENPKFNIEMVRDLDPEVGEVDCFPQDLMRVFLNLIGNGMYAAHKRADGEGAGFKPTISLTSRMENGAIEVAVRDNGPGISADLRERIFEPFFTTKPAGEGTGLGLSLSYDIVVKEHGGELTVDSKPGEFTVFRVTLPTAHQRLS